MDPLFDMLLYILTYAVKIPVDIAVGISQDGNSQIVQIFITRSIFHFPRLFKMLRTVKLYNKLSRRAVKIYNVPAKNLLPIHCDEQFL